MRRIYYLGAAFAALSGTFAPHQAQAAAAQSPRTTNAVQQQTSLSGIVTDANGEPVTGASVAIEGKGVGAVTDINGRFTIDARPGDKLTITYVGYNPMQVTARADMRITLTENASQLGEVVVVGYGTQKKVNLTGAVANVNVKEAIASRPITDVAKALQGITPGLTITNRIGGVGTQSTVKLRGSVGSLSAEGGTSPLILVDNVEVPNLNLVNPDDIETISVLKDAASASIYGTRAAWGVILITTKKGTVGRPKVSFSNSTTFTRPFVTPQFQNTYGRKEGEFASWGEKMERPSNYNPLDFFNTGFNVSNSVALSTGSETSQTHISVGAVNAGGIVPNNRYNRYNFTFRNSWDVIKDVLQLDFSLLYVKQNTRNGIGQGMYYNPLVPTYLFPPSDDINRYAVYEMYNPVRNFKTQNWPYGNLGLGMQNPFWIVNRNKFETNRERFIASFSARWNITSWLNILGRARMDNAYTDFERKLYASTDGLFSKPAGNWMTQDDKNTSTYLDFLINIDKQFANDEIRLLANIGGSYFDERYTSKTFEGNLARVPNFFHPSNMSPTESNTAHANLHTQTQSFYAKVEVGYRNFLFADATGRIDFFSTLLGTSSNNVFYPSVGASVLLTEVLPLPKNIFSLWKIRGSYAQVGNPPSPYLTREAVALSSGTPKSGAFTPASHLKPEMTKAFELGMDLRLFDNKLNIAATYYNSNTYNQLFRYKLPPSSGYEYAFENAGKVNNWGVELSATYNQKLGPVDWSANLVYSLNRNEIKELLPEYVTDRTTNTTVKAPTEFEVSSAESYKMILRKGGTMSDIYASHLKQDYQGNILANGGVQKDENDFVKVGSAAPRYNISLRNSFAWKGIELGFMFDARVGGVVVSATQALMDQFGVSKQTADARDAGGVRVNNGLLNAEQYYGVAAGGRTGLLAHYTYSATNVRLREMSISYDLPTAWFANKLKVNLSLTGHNLLMIYNRAPFDPELTANTGTYYQGFDYFMPPSQRSMGFGVKVNF